MPIFIAPCRDIKTLFDCLSIASSTTNFQSNGDIQIHIKRFLLGVHGAGRRVLHG